MKYLLFLAIKSRGKKARGFTLIELLVVVVILGVLAAVGLPNLLGQVSKAREAEALAILGQINRAQQAYRYEYGIFASVQTNELPISGIDNARYYTFSDYVPPNTMQSSYRAQARPEFDNDIKNYAGGVRLLQEGRLFSRICEAWSTSQDNVFVIEGICSADGTEFGIPPSPRTPAPLPPFRPG